MPIIKAFLSHKAIDGELAKEVSDALSEALPFAEFFLCEEIRKGKDFRSDIWEELTKAKFFVFLYTGPLEDWSWCCFEAGAYKSKMSRPLYCLHAGGVQPPSPLSDLQSTKGEVGDILRWVEDIGETFGRRRVAAEKKRRAAAEKIAACIGRETNRERGAIHKAVHLDTSPPAARRRIEPRSTSDRGHRECQHFD